MNLKSDRGYETSVLLLQQCHSQRSLTFSFLNVILWLSFIKAANKKIQEHHLEALVLLPDNLPAELPLIFPKKSVGCEIVFSIPNFFGKVKGDSPCQETVF